MKTTLTRDKPSTSARKKSYAAMRRLFDFLDKLTDISPWRKEDEDDTDIDFKGWKEWANRHTPPDKRGGPSEPIKRRRKKKNRGDSKDSA